MSQVAVPGAEVPIEARWVHNNAVVYGNATVQYRTFVDGAKFYWTLAGWSYTISDFAMDYDMADDCYRHIVIPDESWIGKVVVATVYMPGRPDMSDTISVDKAVADLVLTGSLDEVVGTIE